MDDKEEGNAIKKQSVLKLFDATSNGMKKLYNRWIRITKRDMTLKQVTSMMNWMDSLHTQTSQMFDILFQDQKTYRIKVAAIEKLISASGANSVSAIRIWR